MSDTDVESDSEPRSTKKLMRAIAITTVVLFFIVVIALSTVTALAIHKHNQYQKEQNDEINWHDRDDIESRWARKNKVCLGKPPGMPKICMSWNWKENDAKIGTIVNYYCRNNFEIPESQTRIVRRVKCNDNNRWVITLDDVKSCDCPDNFREPRESLAIA